MACKACGKELTGKEKYLCGSCSIKVKSMAKDVGKFLLGLGMTAVTIFGLFGKNNDSDEDDHQDV